jgi:hypothetical protein
MLQIMLQFVIEVVFEGGLRVVGWAAMKVITFGRYRGFQPEDMHLEGFAGLCVIAVAFYGGWRWLT